MRNFWAGVLVLMFTIALVGAQDSGTVISENDLLAITIPDGYVLSDDFSVVDYATFFMERVPEDGALFNGSFRVWVFPATAPDGSLEDEVLAREDRFFLSSDITTLTPTEISIDGQPGLRYDNSDDEALFAVRAENDYVTFGFVRSRNADDFPADETAVQQMMASVSFDLDNAAAEPAAPAVDADDNADDIEVTIGDETVTSLDGIVTFGVPEGWYLEFDENPDVYYQYIVSKGDPDAPDAAQQSLIQVEIYPADIMDVVEDVSGDRTLETFLQLVYDGRDQPILGEIEPIEIDGQPAVSLATRQELRSMAYFGPEDYVILGTLTAATDAEFAADSAAMRALLATVAIDLDAEPPAPPEATFDLVTLPEAYMSEDGAFSFDYPEGYTLTSGDIFPPGLPPIRYRAEVQNASEETSLFLILLDVTDPNSGTNPRTDTPLEALQTFGAQPDTERLQVEGETILYQRTDDSELLALRAVDDRWVLFVSTGTDTENAEALLASVALSAAYQEPGDSP